MNKFQSTLPVWGATLGKMDDHQRQRHFNPRSPCGERPAALGQFNRLHCISIHAPRVGSDGQTWTLMPETFIFQSTLPVWGATHIGGGDSVHQVISIHAPRVGSDR